MEQNITKDSKIVKILAENVQGKHVNADDMTEVNEYVKELAQDPNPQNRYQIGQVLEFTINKLQATAMDYLGNVAHVLNINYGDQACFDYKTEGIKVMVQAKGSTPLRSYVAAKRITIPTTEEIATRPAINLVDLRSGRVNMSDLIAEANRKITNGKTKVVEDTFIASMSTYASPFYGTGTGVVKTTLDNQLAYFNRLGPVTIFGDRAAIQKIVPLVGFYDAGGTQHISDALINEYNDSGLIGRYIGNPVVQMANVYEDQQTTPILRTDALYLLVGAPDVAARHLKIVNEGGLISKEGQNIDDMTLEYTFRSQFGCCWLQDGRNPFEGLYIIQ